MFGIFLVWSLLFLGLLFLDRLLGGTLLLQLADAELPELPRPFADHRDQRRCGGDHEAKLQIVGTRSLHRRLLPEVGAVEFVH